MKKTAIFYGTTTGNTEYVAKIIAEKTDADLFNIADKPVDKIGLYQNLILGTSTWGFGDLQDDWYAFLPELLKADLKGKKIALFGLGDSASYPDTFINGMALIFNAIKNCGCLFIGSVATGDYCFNFSRSVINGKFVGLPIDEDNESDLTLNRIEKWIEEIKSELN